MFRTKVAEEIETHILCLTTFFFPENRAVYEVMWKSIVECGRTQTTWRMRIACWIPGATNTNNYCFPTATMVARTRLSVTLHVHFLSCFY